MDCTCTVLSSTFTMPQSVLQWLLGAAAMQGAASRIGSNLGLSVSPKDTTTAWGLTCLPALHPELYVDALRVRVQEFACTFYDVIYNFPSKAQCLTT